MLGRHHGERLCKQNAEWEMNPDAVKAGASQQVKKSRWTARQRRGLHMLSGGSWRLGHSPQPDGWGRKGWTASQGKEQTVGRIQKPQTPISFKREGDLCGQDRWHITAVPVSLAQP